VPWNEIVKNILNIRTFLQLRSKERNSKISRGNSKNKRKIFSKNLLKNVEFYIVRVRKTLSTIIIIITSNVKIRVINRAISNAVTIIAQHR
jgi:hypothetical protein